jgi:hypothetical protein
MAIEYTIDDSAGVLTMVLSGDVTIEDFSNYFEDTWNDPRYRPELQRLVVLRDVRSFPQSSEVRLVASRIRSRTTDRSMRVAVVANSLLGRGMLAMIMGNAGLGGRYEVFEDATTAMVWLVGAAGRSAAARQMTQRQS